VGGGGEEVGGVVMGTWRLRDFRNPTYDLEPLLSYLAGEKVEGAKKSDGKSTVGSRVQGEEVGLRYSGCPGAEEKKWQS